MQLALLDRPRAPAPGASDRVILGPEPRVHQRPVPGLHRPTRIAGAARRHQIGRPVVVTNAVQMIDLQSIVIQLRCVPSNRNTTPVTPMRAKTNPVVENDAMLVGHPPQPRDRMPWLIHHPVATTVADSHLCASGNLLHAAMPVLPMIVLGAKVGRPRTRCGLATLHGARPGRRLCWQVRRTTPAPPRLMHLAEPVPLVIYRPIAVGHSARSLVHVDSGSVGKAPGGCRSSPGLSLRFAVQLWWLTSRAGSTATDPRRPLPHGSVARSGLGASDPGYHHRAVGCTLLWSSRSARVPPIARL